MDVAKKLKFDYAYGPKEHVDKVLSGLDPLFAAYRKPKARTHDLLEMSANIIYRQLRIREMLIGLRDSKDGHVQVRGHVWDERWEVARA